MFEYDRNKSASNKAKHGIGFKNAQELWRDDKRIEIKAGLDGGGEERWLVVGRMALGRRCWSVVVTYRGDRIRIISARRARDDEEALYEHSGL